MSVQNNVFSHSQRPYAYLENFTALSPLYPVEPKCGDSVGLGWARRRDFASAGGAAGPRGAMRLPTQNADCALTRGRLRSVFSSQDRHRNATCTYTCTSWTNNKRNVKRGAYNNHVILQAYVRNQYDMIIVSAPFHFPLTLGHVRGAGRSSLPRLSNCFCFCSRAPAKTVFLY